MPVKAVNEMKKCCGGHQLDQTLGPFCQQFLSLVATLHTQHSSDHSSVLAPLPFLRPARLHYKFLCERALAKRRINDFLSNCADVRRMSEAGLVLLVSSLSQGFTWLGAEVLLLQKHANWLSRVAVAEAVAISSTFDSDLGSAGATRSNAELRVGLTNVQFHAWLRTSKAMGACQAAANLLRRLKAAVSRLSNELTNFEVRGGPYI